MGINRATGAFDAISGVLCTYTTYAYTGDYISAISGAMLASAMATTCYATDTMDTYDVTLYYYYYLYYTLCYE